MQFYEGLQPAKAEAAPAASSDFSSLIQSEVADMKDSKRKRLFEFHNTGISGLLYLIMDKEAGIYRQPSVLLHAASWLCVITIA